MKTKIEKVSADNIQHGDTIMIDGEMQTVNKKFIKNGFCGIIIYGMNYRNGVERVLFPKWFKGEIIGYYAQI